MVNLCSCKKMNDFLFLNELLLLRWVLLVAMLHGPQLTCTKYTKKLNKKLYSVLKGIMLKEYS